jgi:hypothetical protein
MTTTPNTIVNTRSKQQAILQKMTEGLQKHGNAVGSFMIAGTSFKTADLITVLQSRLDATKAAESTRAAWQSAVKADHDERAKTKVFLSGLRQALLVAFAGSIDTLADFGLVARKARVISPEKKVAAAERARATRAARHTMSKKQKAAIKGTVAPTAPPTAPSASPPVPVPVPAPVPAHPG